MKLYRRRKVIGPAKREYMNVTNIGIKILKELVKVRRMAVR